MAKVVSSASITAENVYSDAIRILGRFNFSLSGTWVATVHVQRRHIDGAGTAGSWLDVKSFTANDEWVGEEVEDKTEYRFGVKTGNFTSGTVVGRLSQ